MLLSGNVNTLVSISLWDYISAEWDSVVTNQRINKTSSMTTPMEFKFLLRNENLRYTNATRNVTLQYRFYNASIAIFNIRFFYIKFTSLKGYEIVLRNTKSVALEFDTKGQAEYSWILCVDPFFKCYESREPYNSNCECNKWD